MTKFVAARIGTAAMLRDGFSTAPPAVTAAGRRRKSAEIRRKRRVASAVAPDLEIADNRFDNPLL
jgi:hypothetical protein